MRENNKKNIALVIAIVLLVALTVRALRLEINGLNGDEMLQIRLSQIPDLRDGIFRYIRTMARECLGQAQPLATYALARWSTDLFGFNLLGFRFPSIVAGTAFPVLVAAFFAIRVSPFFGLLAGLIPATYYWHIGVSLLARPYAVASLLGLITYLIWSLPVNDPLRKRIPRGTYLFLVAFGILTNLFYFVTFAALSLLDLARMFLNRKDSTLKKAYFRRFFEFWIPGTILLPYLLLLVKRQITGGWKPPSVGVMNEIKKAIEAVGGGAELIPRIFSTSMHLPFGIYYFLIISGLAIALFIRSQRKHYFLLLFNTVWVALALGCAFSYGSMVWWGENYITLLRVQVFCVTLLILGKIWLDNRSSALKPLVIALLVVGLGTTSRNLAENWKNPYYEDWIAATKFIQTIPPETELRFSPEWLYDLNFETVGKILQIKLRKDKEVKNPNRICTVSFAALAKPSTVDIIYAQSGVSVACAPERK